jgi:hypothetical protein
LGLNLPVNARREKVNESERLLVFRNDRDKITRRKFLGCSTIAASTFTIIPRHVLGGKGYIPPSEKLNLAGIGVGNMGMGNVGSLSSENIVALCDVDDNYAAKTFKQYAQAKKYRDFRKMLDREKNIDGVIVATPDHTHFIISMTAILQGKHVYCEKPLTQTVEQAQRVTDAAVITAGEKTEVMIRCQHDPGRLAGAKGRRT